MNIVLLGGPGAGKGTQAQILAEKLHIPHISSGDLFREHLKEGTTLGQRAKTYLDRGELVPDDVTIAMIRERLARADCANGVILDGFPRTLPQAEALQKVLADQGKELDLAAYIKASPETLLARLSGRWTCRQCGAVFHVLFSPPREPGKCDLCGGELYQRADDSSEVQRRRIEVYFAQTAPLIEYYRRQGLLVEVDGEQDIAEVQSQLWAVISCRQEKKQG